MNSGRVVVTAALMTLSLNALAEVTLYGRVHVSFDHLNDGAEGGEFFSSNSSRLGVKASQALGHGLTGLAQFETGVDLSDSTKTWGATRDSYAGLRGDFGTLLGGRLPLATQWIYGANYFPDQLGDAGNFSNAGVPGRADHALNYLLPLAQPYSVAVTYVPKQSVKSDATVLKSMVGLKAGYVQGPIAINTGYFDLAQLGKAAFASARYAFDTGTVAAMVVNRDTKADPIYGGGIASSKVSVVTLGADYRIWRGTIKAQFSSAGESQSGAKDGATMTALGYDYPLADNATAYVTYATVSNDTNGNYIPSNWGHGSAVNVSAAGKDPNGISFGLLISF